MASTGRSAAFIMASFMVKGAIVGREHLKRGFDEEFKEAGVRFTCYDV